MRRYLACSVLLNETHDFLKLIVNSINNDLISRSETAQCLALTCIAIVSNKEMAEVMKRDFQDDIFFFNNLSLTPCLSLSLSL